MKKLTLTTFLVFFGSIVFAEQNTSDIHFLDTIEDLPLAPGMDEINSANIIFETATGRIAEAQALGKNNPITIRDFYRKTLPQLGWTRISTGIYQRENEILKIEISTLKNSNTKIIFSLKPLNP